VERWQRAGVEAIGAALVRGELPRLVLARRGATGDVAALVDRLRAQGVAVSETSANDLRRMSAVPAPCDALALYGPDPNAPLDEVLARPGAAWLLGGVAYPGNAGYAIRTAEVSGAAAILLDCGFDTAGRRLAARAAMHAERFFPVRWMQAADAIDAARAAGRRVLAIEDSGAATLFDADLRGPVLFVIGGERHGIAPALLARCDATLRIPMRGFIPAYNVQAAMAMVAGESLRKAERDA
jgi:tRNA G18 (ribose-2'-O)-methylase SpoU